MTALIRVIPCCDLADGRVAKAVIANRALPEERLDLATAIANRV
ncbi:hypothetical protein [Novosphingobium sp.]